MSGSSSSELRWPGPAPPPLCARVASTAPIELIGAEPQLPYNRPPLSKEYLRGQAALRGSARQRPPITTPSTTSSSASGSGSPGSIRAESRRPGRRRRGAVRPAPGRHGRAEPDAHHPRRGASGHLPAADGGGLRPHSCGGPLGRARGRDRPRLHRLRGVGVSPPDRARGHRHRGPPGALGPCPRQRGGHGAGGDPPREGRGAGDGGRGVRLRGRRSPGAACGPRGA